MRKIPPLEAPRILISRGDKLGDLILATALIRPLKQRYPACQIYFLAKKEYWPLLQQDPEISGLIEDILPYSLTKDHWPQVFQLGHELKKYKFEIFLGLWEKRRYALLSFWAGIKYRVGWAINPVNSLLYNCRLSLDILDFTLHQAEKNLMFLRPFGLETNCEPTHLSLSPDALAQLTIKFPLLEQRYLTICVDAPLARRLLNIHHQYFLEFLLQIYTGQIVLIGQKGLHDQIQTILPTKHNPKILDLTDQLDLKQTAGVIAKAEFFIGADSGLAHMAAAFNRKTLVYHFHRIQNPLFMGPWQTQNRIVFAHYHCPLSCSPNDCLLLTCRQDLAIADLFTAFTELQKDTSAPLTVAAQKKVWAKIALRVVYLDCAFNNQATYYLQLKQSYNHIIFINAFWSLRKIKEEIVRHNISQLFYNPQFYANLSLPQKVFLQLKLKIALIWASNYIYFYPRILDISRFEESGVKD